MAKNEKRLTESPAWRMVATNCSRKMVRLQSTLRPRRT
jgi:hypothetical protein